MKKFIGDYKNRRDVSFKVTKGFSAHVTMLDDKGNPAIIRVREVVQLEGDYYVVDLNLSRTLYKVKPVTKIKYLTKVSE